MQIRTHMGISIDGFVATPDGRPVVMLMPDFVGTESHGQREFLAQCGAVAMGRTTFDPAVDAPSWPWPGKRVYVLTSWPLPGGLPVEVTSAESVEALVGKMRSDNVDGDVHLVGGPQTVHAFHAAGLLDRLELLAFPVLVGHGLSLSPAGIRLSRYRLDRHQSFDDGTVEMVYVPL